MKLNDDQLAMLHGEAGQGAAFAMELLIAFGRTVSAQTLIPITAAHVDGCLSHGQVSLDFVRKFADARAKVRVPTTLNVGSIDLIHPELFAGNATDAALGRAVMETHIELGCTPSFTCAPYQTLMRPRFGDQIAWAESNAIVFANSVIGARTARYGDFIDLACAITGYAPAHSYHLDENRGGRILFRVDEAAASSMDSSVLAVAVGLLVGKTSGDVVPVIEGLPSTFSEDDLKALGAAAASTGQVGMFHAIGLTPEAPDQKTAFHGRMPERALSLTQHELMDAVANLSRAKNGSKLSAVCLGTPHFSMSEFAALEALLADGPSATVPIYVNTGRETLGALEASGSAARLFDKRVIIVADTCTYITAILRDLDHVIMTNSGKWALYAPGNIGAAVAFGSLVDCVASARAGKIVQT
jgi:predicted aconitase